MKKNHTRRLIFIFLILALAIYLNLSNHPGIQIGSFDREIQTRLGLDLVGGVQTLLEADVPEDEEIAPANLRTARRIIADRVNDLGVTEAVVQTAGDRRILVELPGQENPEEALATVQETALLEFVDFGEIPVQEAVQLVGSEITTDFFTQAASSQEPGKGSGEQRVFHTVMTGSEIKRVAVSRTQSGEYMIAFELNPEGAQTFARYTAENVGKILAIVLDKVVISTPQISQAIPSGQGSISGDFNLESANNLALQLRSGSLPIPLKVVQTQTIGPTLGEVSLEKSLLAGMIGLSLVIIYMALYYRLPGIAAVVSLLISGLVTFAVYRWIPVTLTLAGMAGFGLSIGFAVDGNVVLLERIKDQLRKGRTIRQAIDLGWERAWPSIRNSKLSTLIITAVLFWFGSTSGVSFINGFSLTLAIGVLATLFTAVMITRTLLHLLLDHINAAERWALFGV